MAHCIRAYRSLASCLQTVEYPAIPEVLPPTEEEIAEDASGLLRFWYQERVKANNKKPFSVDEKKPLMYGTIFAQLSKESKDRARRDPNWDEIEASQDPFRLQLIIRTTRLLKDNDSLIEPVYSLIESVIFKIIKS